MTAKTLRGQIVFHSGGSVTTVKGKKISGKRVIGGKVYSLAGATSSKREAQKSAEAYKKQFGTGRVIKLEPGNYGIFTTFGK
jgi:hypothetical protein